MYSQLNLQSTSSLWWRWYKNTRGIGYGSWTNKSTTTTPEMTCYVTGRASERVGSWSVRPNSVVVDRAQCCCLVACDIAFQFRAAQLPASYDTTSGKIIPLVYDMTMTSWSRGYDVTGGRTDKVSRREVMKTGAFRMKSRDRGDRPIGLV